jgi:uracil phosphoribosyltransferase
MDQHLTIVDHPLVQHKLTLMRETAKTLGLAGRYIQVEAYVRTANADRAHKRLAQVGLPVEHRVVNCNGSQLNLILAGPF